MARAVGIEPCTLVMDLEGTDGRERGEVPPLPSLFPLFVASYISFLFATILLQDDTAFDRQSALFALAISDIVLINM